MAHTAALSLLSCQFIWIIENITIGCVRSNTFIDKPSDGAQVFALHAHIIIIIIITKVHVFHG